MQNQVSQLQVSAQIIVSHTVGSVDVMPTSSQPTGATGDARLVTVNFTDGTTPVNVTIADLKQMGINFGTQATNLTSAAGKATTSQTAINSVVSMTAGL